MRGKKAKALRRAANRVPWVEVAPPASIWARLARWWRSLWTEAPRQAQAPRPRRLYRLAKRSYSQDPTRSR